MADETRVKWLYPPNFEGTYDDFDEARVGHRRHIVHCTNISDGSGEDLAIKIKRDDLRTASGNVPAKLIIDRIMAAPPCKETSCHREPMLFGEAISYLPCERLLNLDCLTSFAPRYLRV